MTLFFISSCNQEKKKSTSEITITTSLYTKKQSTAGQPIYMQHCVACHGRDLRGTEGGVALVGERFTAKWKDSSLASLFELTKNTMPKTNPHSLKDEDYAAVLAYIFDVNQYPAGNEEFPASGSRGLAYKPGPAPGTPSRISLRFNAPTYSDKPPTIEAEWLQHRGDYASTNYSPLAQINKDNAKDLKILWRWKTENFGPSPEFYFKATPLMANGILYTTAGTSRTVAAINGATGETLWTFRYDEKERKTSVPRQNSGRGVAYWKAQPNAKDRVIYITPGFQLIALDAATGQPVQGFGKNGVVDLRQGLDQKAEALTATIGSTSPPIIVNDVIIVGASFPVGLAPVSKTQVRGDIMGYDVKTGKRLWIFHTIPQKGEEGNESWEGDSWKYTGNAGAWAPLTADPELGYVYLPLEAATGDFYGGHRPGNNLFSQSLVCLDAKTGKKVWHYQLIHHDIWDYDLPAPPILADINVNGQPIKAVVQLTKQAFAFVFDRVTGKPVWPIEERPVPKSEVKGEWTSPTQPFPTKPAAYDRQGYHDSVLIDFTPKMRKEALQIVQKYKRGPLYTPVTVYDPPNHLGTLMLPDAVGGANWQGGVFDPETKMLYVSSSTVLRPMSLEAAPQLSDMNFVAYMGSSRIGPHGLPLVKPPYGRITAIDLNSGEHRWMIANADSPEWIKNNEALKGLNIPRTGMPDRVGMLVTKTLLFAGEGAGLYASDGGGGNKFRAHDKATGAIISELELPAYQAGIPMTYSINGKQYIVVAVGAVGKAGELVCVGL
ncbi:PQQ-binding-like beta-propeller repeat protein [Pollutibacter soli]|uniref:outer membrane protein assembly factor BamB family protein n=1 Tax=Pollutibacter soli TaxID=3034157 RepID=UPI003013CC7F